MRTNRRITECSIVVASDNHLSTDLSGQAVILNAKTATYHSMEGVGARIWNLLQRPRSVHEIHKALLAEYDVDWEPCLRDLLSFLTTLQAQELVEVHEQSVS